ncbi:hypothetical protein F4780DRAFT_563307 [Xylariomycetidae sp. FL0641]|nr:hypothetical protein F4780DRAFT_563307 [Xylariomycetidae sp. FL0641]
MGNMAKELPYGLTPEQASRRRKEVRQETDKALDELEKRCPPYSSKMRTQCLYCDEPGTSMCTSCDEGIYCSDEHQAADAPVHQLVCASIPEFSADKRPSNRHRRAILFPADEDAPRFIWVSSSIKKGRKLPGVKEYFGKYAKYEVMWHDILAPLLQSGHESGHKYGGCGLLSIGLHEKPVDGVPVNKSITALGKPGHSKSWLGNQIIVAHRRWPTTTKEKQGINMVDVNARDFRRVVDMYHHHPLNPCITDPDRYPRETVPGVISEFLSIPPLPKLTSHSQSLAKAQPAASRRWA